MFDTLINELTEQNPDGRKFDLDVKVKLLRAGATMPLGAKPGDACHDIYFCPDNRQNITLLPGSTALLETGLAVEIPFGWEMLVRPRSGLAAKNQMTVLNTPGTIDSGYRGEVVVIAHRIRLIGNDANTRYTDDDIERFTIKPGDRIAQICFKPVYEPRYEKVKHLTESERGDTGFGSSGT